VIQLPGLHVFYVLLMQCIIIVLVQKEIVCLIKSIGICKTFFLSFSEEFVLPLGEARRHFRAYNHTWNLQISEEKLQRVLDSCTRNSNIGIDDALRLFAK
jgi:hypothetical protein